MSSQPRPSATKAKSVSTDNGRIAQGSSHDPAIRLRAAKGPLTKPANISQAQPAQLPHFGLQSSPLLTASTSPGPRTPLAALCQRASLLVSPRVAAHWAQVGAQGFSRPPRAARGAGGNRRPSAHLPPAAPVTTAFTHQPRCSCSPLLSALFPHFCFLLSNDLTQI